MKIMKLVSPLYKNHGHTQNSPDCEVSHRAASFVDTYCPAPILAHSGHSENMCCILKEWKVCWFSALPRITMALWFKSLDKESDRLES